MKPQDEAEVLKLSVTETQKPYVGTIDEVFANLTPQRDCHVLEVGEDIVGFFIIDRAYAEQYDFCEAGHLGFRAYFIDQHHQGQGYGKASVYLLHDYLMAEYPAYPAVVLTVNCRNGKARQLYLDGGFVDNGELYHGGAVGPQHILRMSLF